LIVQEPPYDLVALFSDLEMQKLFEVLLERGQVAGRNCTRRFRWRSLRDPRRDTVWNQPERPLAPFLRMDCFFLIVWDHQGSGSEEEVSSRTEDSVVARLEVAGIPAERILAVALDPELECLFRTVWPKVKSTVAQERGVPPPDDSSILGEARRSVPKMRSAQEFGRALGDHPKEVFEALVRLVRLRRAAPLYEKIAGQISLPLVKKESAAERIALRISSWFPPSA
jgi:hypothetical protein